jgi:RND family efflux transporter MFP subunit
MSSVKPSPISGNAKRSLLWLLVLLSFAALALLMKASGNGQKSAPPTISKIHQVNAMPIKWFEQYQQKRLAVGQVEAQQQAMIGFDMAGAVIKILVEEGDFVSQGQVLAELDPERLLAKMQELSASLVRANSEAQLAKLSLRRTTKMVQQKLESEQRLDEAKIGLAAANAFVDEVIAKQQSLQVELRKTKLHAPFDGNVASRLIDSGTVVSAGQIVFNIQQDAQLQVRFALPADYARGMSVGDFITVLNGFAAIQGEIKSISNQRRLDTRTVDLIIRLEKQDKAVLSGDLLTIQIESEIQSAGIWLPRQALVSGVRGLWSLFVIEQTTDGTHLVAKLVEILYGDDQNVFIRGALTNGEQVVIEGVHRLVPGQKVQVNKNTETPVSKAQGSL